MSGPIHAHTLLWDPTAEPQPSPPLPPQDADINLARLAKPTWWALYPQEWRNQRFPNAPQPESSPPMPLPEKVVKVHKLLQEHIALNKPRLSWIQYKLEHA